VRLPSTVVVEDEGLHQELPVTLLQEPERLRPAARRSDLPPGSVQGVGQGLPDHLVVVHNEKAHRPWRVCIGGGSAACESAGSTRER
jgi:hypothetical protein